MRTDSAIPPTVPQIDPARVKGRTLATEKCCINPCSVILEASSFCNMSKSTVHCGYVTYSTDYDDALSGGPLETLIVIGIQFPLWEARIKEVGQKIESHELQQLYCPVCPSVPLRIGVDPVAKCGICGWTSSKVEGLHRVLTC